MRGVCWDIMGVSGLLAGMVRNGSVAAFGQGVKGCEA